MKSNYKILLPVVFLLLTTGITFAQNCNTVFEGNIISIEENIPLEAAIVEVIGTENKVISSINGYFKLEDLCPDSIIKIKISHLNCPDYFREIDLNKSLFENFYLDHKVEELSEITLVDDKINDLSTNSRSFSLSELEKERYSDSGLAMVLEKLVELTLYQLETKFQNP